MKEKIKLYGAILLLVILIPYMVTLFFHDEGVGLFNTADTESVFEEKVLLLVSEEISGAAQTEAIKAQAVIARTNLYQNPGQEVVGNEENLRKNREKLQFCVEETAGEILTCDGKPIDGAYHSVSGKKTRNGEEVPGQEDKSYLKSVESLWDITATDYLHIFYMEKRELAEKLQKILPEETVEAETILTDLIVEARDSGDYVIKVRYKDTVLNGEAVRDALGLDSSLFYFTELDGKVRVMTKGLGHGLGLSQFGANEMAKEGKKYQEILKYYYSGVEITKVKVN